MLTIGGALIPATQAWVGKLVIDSVVDSINRGVDAQAGLSLVLPYLAFEFALLAELAILVETQTVQREGII